MRNPLVLLLVLGLVCGPARPAVAEERDAVVVVSIGVGRGPASISARLLLDGEASDTESVRTSGGAERDRFGTYHLSPGPHTFEVIVRDEDGGEEVTDRVALELEAGHRYEIHFTWIEGEVGHRLAESSGMFPLVVGVLACALPLLIVAGALWMNVVRSRKRARAEARRRRKGSGRRDTSSPSRRSTYTDWF